MNEDLILHGYWRSSAAYRVRITLNFKGLTYDQVTHDLRIGAHRQAPYTQIAPHGLVPSLVQGANTFIQSPAILEWLEEAHPQPPLLPAKADARAIVRAMAAIITCDIHPLNNLRVLNVLRNSFGADDAAIRLWVANWVGEGFAALETLVARHGGGFCYGSSPTIADVVLVPQLYAAARFGVDTAPYPALVAAAENAAALPAFRAAHPDRQPDADR